MDPSPYIYSIKKRQEQFSIAYIRAVAAAAGYSVDSVVIDEDSVDVCIKQRGSPDDPEVYPTYSTVRLQVKCTYYHQPKPDGYIHFPLKVKNYNDLRREKAADSTLLVVLYIPSERETDWLIEHEKAMLLQNTAHWISIRGKPAIDTDSKTVLIPLTQRFDVNGLREIMNRLANGEML